MFAILLVICKLLTLADQLIDQLCSTRKHDWLSAVCYEDSICQCNAMSLSSRKSEKGAHWRSLVLSSNRMHWGMGYTWVHWAQKLFNNGSPCQQYQQPVHAGMVTIGSSSSRSSSLVCRQLTLKGTYWSSDGIVPVSMLLGRAISIATSASQSNMRSVNEKSAVWCMVHIRG